MSIIAFKWVSNSYLVRLYATIKLYKRCDKQTAPNKSRLKFFEQIPWKQVYFDWIVCGDELNSALVSRITKAIVSNNR